MRAAIVSALSLIVLVAGLVATSGAGGGAGELPFNITGQVREIDAQQAQIILSDGTQLFASNPLQLQGIREGQTVQVSGEQREGKKIILRIEPAARQ